MPSSIIIPAYNEEKAILKVIRDVKNLDIEKEIIVVDDGSVDKTYKLAKGATGVKVLKHKKNRGKAYALDTGIKNSHGDIIVTIDSDCTYPVEAIQDLVKIIERGEADMTLGSRFLHKSSKNISKLNLYGNKFFSFLITLLTFKKITDGSTGLRAFKKIISNDINIKAKGLEWEVEMTTRAIRNGFRVKEIPIEYFSRAGKSKLNPLKDGFRFFIAILRGRFF